MSDLTMTEVIKMKVLDLRKELKSRGLQSTGDKAALIQRLQAALSNDISDDHGDINLDSDEIDSASWCDEEGTDRVSQDFSLRYESSTEAQIEDLLVDQPLPPASIVKSSADKTSAETGLKRKTDNEEVKASDTKTEESREASAKKIILNRATSTAPTPSPHPEPTAKKSEEKDTNADSSGSADNDKIKAEPSVDPKSRLELRAKRFGLPVKMTDAERKEARKLRFGQNAEIKAGGAISQPPLTENLDKLKKRAERFGQSVSKFMTDVENKERLEKRKAKFGTVK